MTLPESLLRRVTAILKSSRVAFNSSSELPAYFRIDIPANLPAGFEIRLEAEASAATVHWGNWHTRFEKTENIDLFIEDLLGLMRDMLSPRMRILEMHVNGRPYKGLLQCYRNESWVTEQSMALLFWNYFGKRSTRMYTNAILPAREQP